MKKILLGIAAILLVTLLAACSEDEEKDTKKEEARVTPVETEKAVKEDFTIEKSVYGRTSPGSTTPIMLQTPGEIDTLEVENGDKVKEDDLIATIETPAGKQNIRAPKDGEIAQLKAAEGDMASVEDPLALVVKTEEMKLEFFVTSGVQSLFSKDDKRKAMINDKKYEVTIDSIGTMPDDTGLYPIEAMVKNEDNKILSGMVAVLTVPEKKLKDVIIIPTAAIVEENDESFVYVVKEDKAKKINVEIKETQSDITAIKSDVKADDQVVVSGQMTLSDGVQVDVVKGE